MSGSLGFSWTVLAVAPSRMWIDLPRFFLYVVDVPFFFNLSLKMVVGKLTYFTWITNYSDEVSKG